MNFIREYQSDIMLVISSICFVIFGFLLITNHISKEKKRALLFFVLSTAFLLLFDRYAYTFRNQSTDIAYILAPLFKYLVFFNILNVVYGFGEFIKCMYIENHPNKKIPITFTIVNFILLIGHIILIISQFTNIYYSFDTYNIYHREKYYFICYLFPLISTILQYIIIIKDFKNTKKHISIPLTLYFTLPLVASVIQLFNPGLSLVNIIIGGVVIILYSATIYDANMMLEEKKKTEADLKLANEIQQNEIPNTFPAFPNNKEFDLFAVMNPAKEVGGDFYDYFLLDDNNLCVVIADVSGKGVPAALNMFKTKLLIKGTSSTIKDPAKVLELVNNSFIDNNKLDFFVTIWFGIIELSSGILKYANAGHDDPIIYTEKNGFELIKSKHGLPIGAMMNTKYENHEVILNKGNRLFLYTDGVTDTINKNNEQFGINNLLKSLYKNKNEDIYTLIKNIQSELNTYSVDCRQFDDITMLCLELIDNKKRGNKNMINKKFKVDLNEIQNVYDFFTNTMSNILDMKEIKKYYIVIDEIFSNIVKYGFKKDTKNGYINIIIDINNNIITIKFSDNGIPFNPLNKEDPDTKLSIKDRKEGGLGIFIVKKMMDNVSYEYKNNENILTIEKKYK